MNKVSILLSRGVFDPELVCFFGGDWYVQTLTNTLKTPTHKGFSLKHINKKPPTKTLLNAEGKHYKQTLILSHY